MGAANKSLKLWDPNGTVFNAYIEGTTVYVQDELSNHAFMILNLGNRYAPMGVKELHKLLGFQDFPVDTLKAWVNQVFDT